MKFPISREQLRDIQKDVENAIVQDNIDLIVNNIKGQILSHAYQPLPMHMGGISKTQLRIDISKFHFTIPNNSLVRIHTNDILHRLLQNNPLRTHYEVIKQRLMELFPDVSFETDPLQTYILVDWT